MTEEQIKDYVARNCCDLCDNRKWCSIQNECFVVNAITEATKELQEELKIQKHNTRTVAYLGDCIEDILDKKLTKAKKILRAICEGYSSAEVSEKEMIKRIQEAQTFLKE